MALATEAVAVRVQEEAFRSPSAVSWAAIIGGALTAVAVTLLLVALGTGIGLSSVSPWSPANPSATTFTLLARMAYHRAVAVIGPWRILERAAADQMGWTAYR